MSQRKSKPIPWATYPVRVGQKARYCRECRSLIHAGLRRWDAGFGRYRHYPSCSPLPAPTPEGEK